MPLVLKIESELDERSASAAADRAQRVYANAARDMSKSLSEGLTRGAREGGQAVERMANEARAAYKRVGDATDEVTAQQRQLNEMREQGARGVEVQAERVRQAKRREKEAIKEAAAAYDEYERAAQNAANAGESAGGGFLAGIRGAAAGAAGAGQEFADGFAGGFAGSGALLRVLGAAGPIGAGLAGLGAVGFAAGAAIVNQVEAGMASMATRDLFRTRLGVDEATMSSLGRSASEAFVNGWGMSTADNLRTLQFGIQGGLIDTDATEAQSQQLIEQMTAVSTAMDEDVQAIARGTRNMISTGLVGSYEEAFDLLTAANAQGLNISDDLLDTMEEYGTKFRDLGLSGAEALGLINQMWEGGARNVDVAADGLKEFAISVTDNSESTRDAFAALGFNADQMTQRFAEGGPVARESFAEILRALQEVDDEQERNQIGLALFKTKWEDMGTAVQAANLDTAATQLGDIRGAADEATAALGEHQSQWDLLGRNIDTTFTKLQEWLANSTIGQFFGQGLPDFINDTLFFDPSFNPNPTPAAPGTAVSQNPLLAPYQPSPNAAAPGVGTNPLDVFAPTTPLVGPAGVPGATRETPVPMPTGGSGGASESLPDAPVLPIQYTDTTGMPSSIANATTRLDEVRHAVAEKEARLNQLRASNVADEGDIQKAENDLAKAQQDQTQAERSLTDAKNNLIEQQIKAAEKGADALGRTSDRLGQVGAQIDQDFGVSEGLPGIAENLTKFLANLAFAPVFGALTGVREANGFGQGEAGGGLFGMAASSGAFGDQFVPVPRWLRNSGSTTGASSSNLGPAALQPGIGSNGAAIDAALLANVPAGVYTQSERGDLTQGLADCSSAVEDLVNIMDGRPTGGASMYTGNAAEWLTSRGFLPGTGGPGDFRVGFNDSHMQATLPGGTPFNWGSDAAAARGGVGGSGAFDPAFTSHYYRPTSASTGGASAAAPDLFSPANTDPALNSPGGAGAGGGGTGIGGPGGVPQSPFLPTNVPALPGSVGASALAGANMGRGAAPSQTATGGRAFAQGMPASGGIGFGGGLIGAAMSGAMGAAGGAMGGLGGGAMAAGSDMAMQLIGRAIGAGGQYAGNAVGGLIETFLPNGSALGDPSSSWFGRLAGAAAGIRPALPNSAGQLGGKENPNMAEAGKKPLTPQQVAEFEKIGNTAEREKAARGGDTYNIEVTNSRAREDGTGRDIQSALMSSGAAKAPQR